MALISQRMLVAPAAVVLLVTGCGGNRGSPSTNATTAAPAGDAKQDDEKGECPFATTAEVTDVMGRKMVLTLWSPTDCEWLQDGNTAVSASVSIVDPELGESFNERNGQPVPGIGDEAYEDKHGLYLRVGETKLEVVVSDTNENTGLDAPAGMRKLATVVAQKLSG